MISWTEFMIAASDKAKLLSRSNLKECFDEMDIDRKGFLTFEDFESLFGSFPELNSVENQQARYSLWQDVIKEAVFKSRAGLKEGV